jgi:N-terminal half of MaoC dehydratase
VNLDASLVGAASEPATFDVEKGAIVKLAEAIGDPASEYRAGEAAPPTFPTTFRMPIPGLSEVDPARFLHGEQEYEYDRPLRAGDRITCVARIADVREKETRVGPATFVVAEIEGRDEAGERVFVGRSTLLVRAA